MAARKTSKRNGATLAVMLVALVVTAPLVAGIDPQHQYIAERLTLKRNDLDSGWRATGPASRKVESVDRSKPGCSTAPKIDQSITGYLRSPTFRQTDGHGNEYAESVTRVFASEALAKRWFEWARSGNAAQCRQDFVAGVWQKEGFKVTRSTRAGQSFVLYCDQCLPRSLQAWAFTRTVEKPGERFKQYEVFVNVRIQYAIVRFLFSNLDRPPVDPESYVAKVLERVSR